VSFDVRVTASDTGTDMVPMVSDCFLHMLLIAQIKYADVTSQMTVDVTLRHSQSAGGKDVNRVNRESTLEQSTRQQQGSQQHGSKSGITELRRGYKNSKIKMQTINH
jgi:hypothetical protein